MKIWHSEFISESQGVIFNIYENLKRVQVDEIDFLRQPLNVTFKYDLIVTFSER